MCECLGEPVKTGRAKKDQLKHWERHFEWERDGHKYIITEIHKPLTQRQNLYHTNTKWYPNISKIILSMTKNTLNGYGVNDLSKKYREVIIASAQLYHLVGLCNSSFQNLKKGREEGADLSPKVQKKCYREISEKFYHIVTRVLKSLNKRQIITYTRHYIVIENLGIHRLANSEEEKTIVDKRDKLLDKYHISSEFWIIGSKYEEKFYDELNDYLSNKYSQLKSCYKVHRIIFHDDEKAVSGKHQYTKRGCNVFRQEINEKIVKELSAKKHDIPIEIIESAIQRQWIDNSEHEHLSL